MPVANALTVSLLEVLYAILNFFIWVLVLSAVLSWLVAFGVVNPYNRFVHVVGDFAKRITEPFLEPIRRILPPMGGLDLAPLALIFIIYFLQRVILHLMLSS